MVNIGKRRVLGLALLLGAILYFCFLFQLGRLPLVGADEPRYARIGEEMLLRGEWVTPTLGFAPWLEKPPLLFWMEALSFGLLGVSEWSARLPVALLAVLTALACGCYAAHRWGKRQGLLTIVILATSPLFFVYGRAASTDLPLVCFFAFAMLCALVARSGKGIWLALSGASLGLATLAKGPVALLLFAAIWGIYAVLTNRSPWRLKHALLGAATFLLVSVPWFYLVWVENGSSFVATFWLNHHLARFLTDVHHHSQPAWYFVPVVLIGFFPWVFFLASALRRAIRQRSAFFLQPSSPLALWLWVLVPFLFFSVSSSKLAGYVLPIFPALALLAAREWEGLLSGELLSFRNLKVQLALANAAALVFAIALLMGISLVYGSRLVGSLLALPVLLGAISSQLAFRRGNAQGIFRALAVSMVLLVILLYWQAAPLVGGFHSAKDLSLRVAPQISKAEPLVFYQYFHHTALYYTDYRCTSQSVTSLEDLGDYFMDHPQTRYWILTQRPGWLELEREFQSEEVIHRGNLYLVAIEP